MPWAAANASVWPSTHATHRVLVDQIRDLETQRTRAVDEAVAFMRDCGPAADPTAWHAFMEKYDPEYEQSDAGKARRALRAWDR